MNDEKLTWIYRGINLAMTFASFVLIALAVLA